MLDLTIELFNSELDSGKTFVVDYYADWCTACSEMLPLVEEVSHEYNDIPFYKVNIDTHQELKDRSKLKAIPMLMIYSGGRMRTFLYGVNPKETIQKKINMVLK
jgi:thioredoxin 1